MYDAYNNDGYGQQPRIGYPGRTTRRTPRAQRLYNDQDDRNQNINRADSRQVAKPVRTYDREGVLNAFRSLIDAIPSNRPFVAMPIGKCAEVVRGLYESTGSLQFFVLGFDDLSLLGNLVSHGMELNNHTAEDHMAVGFPSRLGMVYSSILLDTGSNEIMSFAQYEDKTFDPRKEGLRSHLPSFEDNVRFMNAFNFGDDETRKTLNDVYSEIKACNGDDSDVRLVGSLFKAAGTKSPEDMQVLQEHFAEATNANKFKDLYDSVLQVCKL